MQKYFKIQNTTHVFKIVFSKEEEEEQQQL